MVDATLMKTVSMKPQSNACIVAGMTYLSVLEISASVVCAVTSFAGVVKALPGFQLAWM